MRQVPGAGTPIGVVGGGRLARHFLRYLQLLEIPTCAWSRRAALQDPVETLDGCGTVLLLIRDDQILPFIAAWPGLQSKRLVHCSGSLVTEQAEAGKTNGVAKEGAAAANNASGAATTITTKKLECMPGQKEKVTAAINAYVQSAPPPTAAAPQTPLGAPPTPAAAAQQTAPVTDGAN